MTQHPARFTPSVLEFVTPMLEGCRQVHDPFAGTGERLGALCDELGLTFSGTELEADFIVDPRVHQGDSRDGATYPEGLDWLVLTSPTYGNGLSDYGVRGPTARSRATTRRTYAHSLGRALSPGNTGATGIRQNTLGTYWRLHAECTWHWPELALVNVSDFVHKGELVPMVDEWSHLLTCAGYSSVERYDIDTPRYRNGANAELRAECEAVLVAAR